MRYGLKKGIYLIFTLTLLLGMLSPAAVKAKGGTDCKALCGAALKAAGGSEKLKYQSVDAIDCGALSSPARGKVKKIQYVCDAREVYSLCVIQAKGAAQAKSLLGVFKKYKRGNSNSDYLSDYSATERQVLKNAVCGRKGSYVWYIAMSPRKKDNNKGQNALKKMI